MTNKNNLINMRVTEVPKINPYNLKCGDRIILDPSKMLLFRTRESARKEKNFLTCKMFKDLGYDYCEEKYYKL